MEGAGNLLIGIAMIGTLLVQIYTMLLNRHTAYKIAHLEKNTNSIKDALVKVTGDAAYAKGVLEGKASVNKQEAQD